MFSLLQGKVDDALEIMDILTKADIKANSEKVKMDMSKNYEDFAEYFLTQCKSVNPCVLVCLSDANRKEERKVLFNNALNTFHLQLYGVEYML